MSSSLCPGRSHHTRVHLPQAWTSRPPHLTPRCSPSLRSQGNTGETPGISEVPAGACPPLVSPCHTILGVHQPWARGPHGRGSSCLGHWPGAAGPVPMAGDNKGMVAWAAVGQGGRGAAPRAGSVPLCVPGVPVALPGVWEGWGVPSGTAGEAMAGHGHGCRARTCRCWGQVGGTGVTGAHGVMQVGVLGVLGAVGTR